jgi:hypothetical protein
MSANVSRGTRPIVLRLELDDEDELQLLRSLSTRSREFYTARSLIDGQHAGYAARLRKLEEKVERATASVPGAGL